MRLPKFTPHFLLFVVISKVVYLLVEWYYNIHLIDTITTAKITKEMLTSIESLGHTVSSVGLTLLVTPLFYLAVRMLFKQIKRIPMAVVTVSFMIISYFSFHSALTSLMDRIIDNNKDKRYTSYYISAFKYGMLNGAMGYETFIPKERLKNPTITDKVILSNMFLLNYIDENLTQRMIDKGSDSFVDIFIAQYGEKEYIEAKEKFEEKATSIVDAYNRYIEESKHINDAFEKVDKKEIVEAEYNNLINNLYVKYDDYEKAVIKYETKRDLSDSDLERHYNDLSKYFRYQSYDNAKRKYRSKMNQLFGHYIKPNRWCDGNECPSYDAIERVVAQESLKKWYRKMGKIPPTLGQRAFFKHPTVRGKIVSTLHSKGLYVSKKFNYSKKSFYRAYQKKVDREFKKAKREFLKSFSNETGKKVTFGLSYSQFVSLFKSDIYKEYGKKYGKVLYSLLKKKDTNSFYESFYRPYFKENYLSGYILSKEELNMPEHSERADQAIKHLYVPPFAIGMSLIAGILNLVSLVGIVLFYFINMKRLSVPMQLGVKFTVKTVLLIAIVLYPYLSMKEKNVLETYKALEYIQDDSKAKNYLKILEWVIIFEKVIYVDAFVKKDE